MLDRPTTREGWLARAAALKILYAERVVQLGGLWLNFLRGVA